MIDDVKMTCRVILGKSELTMKQLMNIQIGSVLRLDRRVDEQLDIYIENRKFAKGEVVVLNDSFGVKLITLEA